MHVYVCMYVCMYACMHVCMYVCTYVSMYECMYGMYVCTNERNSSNQSKATKVNVCQSEKRSNTEKVQNTQSQYILQQK